MSTTIAVTGATGFVGGYLVRELLGKGRRVRALARDPARASKILPVSPSLTVVEGDVLDAGAMDTLARGADAMIHLVGIIREERGGQTFERMHVGATRSALAACGRAGLRRYVHMSALGVGPQGKAPYQKTKWEAERLVHASGLDWTIMRPGLIVGEGSEFIEMAKGWASGQEQPWFFMPYFTGRHEDTSVPLGAMISTDPMVQPVAVQDVARAFAGALDRPESIGETYNLVGPDRLSFPDLLRWLRGRFAPGSKVEPWGVPGDAAAGAARAAGAVGLGGFLPFDEGMALMGSRDSVGEWRKAQAHLGVTPRPMASAF
ncbi:MAG: NAD(P)H-binding protein [Phycisphaeraceae bacterium]|nr:MAG: NAD(P)H-binding protein [Phycisphaeraceae bacterium]